MSVARRPPAFRAPAWARNRHVQTIAGKLLRPPATVPVVRERWETPDGDILDLDFGPDPGGKRNETGGPALVVILHGLEGSARRPYVNLLMRELLDRGISAVGMNFRGCSGVPNLTPVAYHSGETGDLAFVLDELRERFPDRPLALAGFSLGGNVLLKYLGERGSGAEDAGVRAAAAVSVPYDLLSGARALEKGIGRLYGRYFLRSLVGKVKEKRRLLEGRVDVDAALSSPTIRAFDEAVTAPLHGFRGAEHYYRVSSSGPFLPRIRVPTLLVQALDDPFLPGEDVPEAAVEANPALVPAFSRRGGHVGFVQGPPWRPVFWAEATVAAFLARTLSAPTGTAEPRHRSGDAIG